MKGLIALPRWILKWLRSGIWPFWLMFRQLFRAAIQDSGITVTVFAAVYSIAIPYLLSKMEKGLALTPSLAIVLLVLALVVSVPLVLVSGWLALKAADPETYSRVLIGGRPAKEVLFTISKRADRACSRTLRLSIWAEELLRRLEEQYRPTDSKYRPKSLPSEWWRRWIDLPIRWASLQAFRIWNFLRRARKPKPDLEHTLLDIPLREEIECLIWWLRRFPHAQHTRLLRIEAMKLHAANELGIPPRRLCDHLFQYSPVMHRDRLQKYVQNWGQILDFNRAGQEDEWLWKITVQNLSFLNNTRRRRRYQRDLLENRDLHPFIVQFASRHSTSGSLQTYADALKFVAMLGERRLARAKGGAWKGEMRAIRSRFAFLHRKQRAHPGYDLHKLLLNSLACMDSESQSELSGVYRVLKGLELIRSASESRSRALPVLSLERLNSFRHLSFRLASLVDSSRKKISQNFRDIYGDWLKSERETRYIVSHGYSRTVSAVLRTCLPSAGTVSEDKLPRLFFLLPDEDSFDTRVMEYEFKEERGLRRFRNFAAGSGEHLLGLLRKHDKVLVLLGAECFDSDRRMVHPRGIHSILDTLMNKLEKDVCRVVVVAESYKCHAGSLIADIDFYGQHFDRIDLYPPHLIHCIITDKEILQGIMPWV